MSVWRPSLYYVRHGTGFGEYGFAHAPAQEFINTLITSVRSRIQRREGKIMFAFVLCPWLCICMRACVRVSVWTAVSVRASELIHIGYWPACAATVQRCHIVLRLQDRDPATIMVTVFKNPLLWFNLYFSSFDIWKYWTYTCLFVINSSQQHTPWPW